MNSLIGFLDKGNTVKDTLGGGRESQALRTVRAKRELDEAGLLFYFKNILVCLSIYRQRLPKRCSLAGDPASEADENLGKWIQGKLAISRRFI